MCVHQYYNSNYLAINIAKDKATMTQIKSASYDDLKNMMKEFNEKLDKIGDTFNQKIDEVRKDLSLQITDLYKAVNAQFNTTNNEIKMAKSQIDDVQRQLYLNDVIVTGVPVTNNERLLDIFQLMCVAVGFSCSGNEINNIFRIPGKTKARPIIVKFTTNFAKNGFTRQYFQHKTLSLKDIGIDASNRIFVNDCLTKINRAIYKEAILKKKQGIFSSVSTRNGYVMVKKNPGDGPNKLTSTESLQQLSF